MTLKAPIQAKKDIRSSITPIICLILTALMLFFSKELTAAVINGMGLAAMRIIPTVFPFMILSDLWISCIEIKSKSWTKKWFERCLGINGSALIALITGIFCGFPLGVKAAVNLYESGMLSKNELERISPIVNLPSLAFVISGVGVGLYGDVKVGISLYISVFLSSLLIGFIGKRKTTNIENGDVIIRQNFNLIDSIKNAGISSLIMSAYITFFSGVIGLTTGVLTNTTISTLLSTIFEVGNSTSLIAGSQCFSYDTKLILTAFALGFSGLSVHLQAFSIMPNNVAKKRYLTSKLLIAFLSSLLYSLFTFTIK